MVTAHAVRVAVTNNLSANITGFLPIHCIYQLLRSRAFTKHKVSIKVWTSAQFHFYAHKYNALSKKCKLLVLVLICILQDWIYRQLCETTMPIHTQLIPLIDAYINSILTPASKANPEATNQPITEQEILNVFLSSAGVSYYFGFITYFLLVVCDGVYEYLKALCSFPCCFI